ncbi:MAG: M28 family peptidase [Planctomycetaceae bacterium]|nr:M28 family peptidase [Planctomycetaceae bacterium]
MLTTALGMSSWNSATDAADRLVMPPVDGRRAFQYLESICAIGPRISGTQGMQSQQELIEKHFTALGAKVQYQEFDAAHPKSGEPVRMKNMIISWHPESQERVLLACHYDTRPFPDRELLPINRTKPFLGANDGGSGVALMMELGHHIPSIRPKFGIDFVIFDGEELVFDRDDPYFLGSEHFARTYRDNPPTHRYVGGVLVDMIADRDLNIFYERNSLKFAPEITREVWDIAKQLGIREFVPRRKHEVRDDHLPLNEIAGIPTCDIIDFDYPYWHKRNDLPAACSADSLRKTGAVVLVWLATHGQPS